MTDRAETGPAIADRADLERPGALPAALAELTQLVTAGGEAPVRRLRALASPAALDVLFRVGLGRLLRRGPGAVAEQGAPARWLGVAAAAARAGALPVATCASLRASLGAVAGELVASGAWAPSTPPWWAPLPPKTELETIWASLAAQGRDQRPVGLPPAERLRAELGTQPPGGGGWLGWADALPPELLARIAGELAAGALDLRGAGVGRADRRSDRRTDQVRYSEGLDPDLLAQAPTLAVLVQHLLERLEEPLRDVLPGRALHAPQTVMLARYPAPSAGFAAHLDNPGGAEDNHRALTLVLYLNASDRPCRGGGLALWPPGAPHGAAPATSLPPAGGSAVLFDSRAVAHAVEPLLAGPDRWTLVVWWSEVPRRAPRPLLPVPAATATEALQGIDDPPVPPGVVVFRRAGAPGAEEVAVERPAPGRRPRAGVVATVGRGGLELAGSWARHHLDLGMDHLLVVLDENLSAAEVSGFERLRRELGPERLTLWTDAEAGRRRAALAGLDGYDALAGAAEGGPAAWAVAARQTLNATAAVRAAASREGDELGAAALDWLVHLDVDEVLFLEGAGRGGAALGEHFAAAEAAGWRTVRYLDHELLLPWRPGEPARFKRNPAQAACRLGTVGWRHLVRHLAMAQGDRRPYFRAYWNGKAAVAVAPEARAAGVHGWQVPGAPEAPLLAGPSVLHCHLPTAEAFRRKYLRVASAAARPDGADRPFPPSALEDAASSLVRELRAAGADAGTVSARLDALYDETTAFAAEAVELLAEAGLLLTPNLAHLPLPEGAVEPAFR